MVLVVLVPLHPEGRFHVYDVAPAVGVTLYVWVVPPHIWLLPLMFPGCIGVVPVALILIVWAIDVPQVEVAVTEIVPPVAPGTATIELVVDVPLQPEGSVQL
jgi:hypothetical protein